MRAYIFILLYGASTLVGSFLAVFWSIFARRRRKSITWPWYQDRYYLVAASIALMAIGQVFVDGARTVGNIQFGLSPILIRTEGYFIGWGLIVLLLGFFGMVWLADLEEHPPKWTWLRRMMFLTLAWAAVAFIINLYVPLEL